MKPRSPLLRRLQRLRDAVSVPVLFLAGVVLLAAVLAYQAQDAARSNVRRAEATLRDYSAFAATEYARQFRLQAFTLLRVSLSGVPVALNFRTPPVDPTAVQVRRLVLDQRGRVEQGIPCAECVSGVRHFFRIGVADGSIDIVRADSLADGGDDAPAAVRRWLRDTVLHELPLLADTGRPIVRTLGTVDAQGRPRGFSYFVSNDAYMMLVGAPDSVSRMIGLVLARDSVGAPLAAYGFEADPDVMLRPLLVRALHEDRLLPPSLLRGLSNEEALSVIVADGDGRPLFQSSDRFDSRFAAADRLPGRYGALQVRVAVFPEIADQLLVGGLPGSRLPLLLFLFLLTVGLAAIAVLQVRRQQELARLRTDFVSSVSHELRTPLAQIRWFAELLRMGRLRSEDERDRSLRIIDQEARRLAFLVENVLNFSRSGQTTGRLSPEPADVAGEVREVVDGFLPLAQGRRVRMETRLEPGAVALVDRGALRQITLNLLDNAVKYGPVGQTVTVGVERIGDERVRLWVEDEGPGVPEEERERVWSPFYRAQRDLVSAVTGSGIGLSVVADLVALQDGRRWIESTPAGGARVVLEFPVPSPDADDAAPERPVTVPSSATAGVAPVAPGATER
ncbi:MAG TPA: HAMP domain-containing sensor histidine kinase [Gemmatimonadaceae bacterium]|nr:HAMP domain-containing sensor histidine kinase [Gemmatimonadaceae bacterium]